jgi:hypothetical protein
MKKILLGFAVALSFAFWAGGAMAQTTAEPGVTWNRWNVAPAARSAEEACRETPQEIDLSDMPADAKAYFKNLIGPDCKGGVDVWLDPGKQLGGMTEKGTGELRFIKNVTVGELPVLRSPDGRPYRKGAVAETARARAWGPFTASDGKTYVWYQAYVCFNSGYYYVPPPSTVEHCSIIRVHVDSDDVHGYAYALRFAFYGRYRPSACFGIKRPGSDIFEPLPVHCPDRNCDFAQISAALGMNPTQSGGEAPLMAGIYEFQVSDEFALNVKNVAAFCLELKDGTHSLGVGIVTGDYHQSIAEIFYEDEVPQGYLYPVVHWRLPRR